MSDRQRLVDQLIRHEGLRLKPYTDTGGKTTIGVGRNLSDVGISDAEALDLLNHDVDACITDLATFPWFPTLDAVRQRALVDLRFNLGAKGFRSFKQTLAAVAAGDYVKASDQMLKSKWASQVKMRARTLARMMATGLALLLLSATGAVAQSHADVVESVKAELEARHVDLSGPCGAFQITKRVAWRLRNDGAGLLSKPSGNNCEGYSVDYVVIAGQGGYDMLSDAGGANGAGWNGPDTTLLDRWRPPRDPGDAAPLPPVVVGPPPVVVSPGPAGYDAAEIIRRLAIIENEALIIKAADVEIKAIAAEAVNQIKEHRAAVSREYYKWAAILGPIITTVLTYFKMRGPTATP